MPLQRAEYLEEFVFLKSIISGRGFDIGDDGVGYVLLCIGDSFFEEYLEDSFPKLGLSEERGHNANFRVCWSDLDGNRLWREQASADTSSPAFAGNRMDVAVSQFHGPE
ncbi:MAG: hypothetical protein VCC01_06395 [Candidatus Hydrogenedentota bacterium]